MLQELFKTEDKTPSFKDRSIEGVWVWVRLHKIQEVIV